MSQVGIRLLFVDEGSYHHETVQVQAEVIAPYGRLIDALREEPALLKSIYVDVDRLCGAWLLDGDDD